MVIVELPLPAVIGDVALTVDCAAETVPTFTTTVAVCVIATELIVAETVFVCAAVELRVPVVTPLALVVPTGCVSVFPVVGVAASTTVAPAIGFPLASLAVTVIVEAPLPAVMGDVAVTLDCAAETVPTFTITLAVCVIATELIVAETVFVSAAVELRVPVATPLASVVPTGCVRVFPAVGVAASTTVAPAIGLPLASFAVTVIVEAPVPATIGDVAVTVDWPADTAPLVTVTVAVCVTATELIVAETVFVPAAVEVRVPAATPLASVVPTGCVSVFPIVGVAARTTVAPAIGLPFPSRAVTVMVEVPLPAAIGEVAVTLDWAADTAPAMPVAVKVTGLPAMPLPLAVAVSVFGPAVAESVQACTVAIPLALVVWLPPVTLPFPGATANVTDTPITGLPLASRTITEGGEATAVPTGADWGFMLLPAIAAAAPGVTVTDAVCVTATASIVAETVFAPAAVELSVPVATPLALVVPTGCVNVLPVEGVAASVTVAP